MAVGYIALGTVAFVLAVNYFAVLPGDAADWDHTFRPILWARSKPKSIMKPNLASPPAPAGATAREGGI
jgi:hypothetical protein